MEHLNKSATAVVVPLLKGCNPVSALAVDMSGNIRGL